MPRTFLVLATCAIALFATAARAQVQAGPGTWSGNQTWAADTVNSGALTGCFYWPSTAPALDNKRALVLVLHGCQQTASGDVINNTDNGFNWKAAADRYGAVILAPNATGNVYGNHCRDYASTRHNRSTGHDAILLDLVNRFVTNSQYAIDPRQVYVAGLSSGGGETMALACLAPDIFAGAGINAGPPPGTTTAQISYVPGGYTAATAGNNCTALAGSNAPGFAAQIASLIWGTSDYTVAQAYGPMDAAAMRLAYGGNFYQGASATVSGATVTVTGAATDPAGAVSSYRVTLTGPTAVDDAAAGSGASFTKSYSSMANGTYAGTVTATDSGTGRTSAACNLPSIVVGTAPPPPSTCTATTSSNYAHVQAGRAHDGGGYAVANGSNQRIGLDNTFYTTTLAQTAAGYYVIGACP